MMEARQFRRYAEEKMSHDAAELAALEDLLAKRDAALRALQSSSSSRGGGGGRGVGGGSGRATPSFPGSSPHHYPSTPTPASAAAAANYPPLRCFIDHPPTASEADALDAQTPREHLTRLAHRVHMLERGVHPMATTTTTTPIIRVAPGSAFPRPTRAYSDADSLEFCDGEYFPDDVDCGASDRVYTVDAIHGRPLAVPEGSCTPGGSSCCGGGGVPLQREKAEAMMEARQFRRYAEEKMSHDAAELAALEDLLAKRDAALRALQSSSSSRGGGGGRGVGGGSGRATPSFPGSSPHHYPVHADAGLRRGGRELPAAATPREHLTRLAHRVHMLERGVHPMATTTTTTPIIRVAPGSAFPRPTRAYSDADSLEFCDGEYFPDDVDCGASDRVYTVDAIHGRPLAVPEGSCTPGGSSCCGGGGVPWPKDQEMRRLSARLQALEPDRETMRQAIVSMGAEKAQVVLLKEIAQQLCKEATPPLPPVCGDRRPPPLQGRRRAAGRHRQDAAAEAAGGDAQEGDRRAAGCEDVLHWCCGQGN
ncbi:hypothetical protein OsJ_36123 [Oryza sativa Japonica Group]|uniref:GTD-binding domain-containing protein n=1 Tax=Oryza sativa subsp. japonica TaxID=39947 RepID=B9GD68_ORYSJ|nr:hypothetical protein OsJ_36123 [Oryza sativa Japonica Group]